MESNVKIESEIVVDFDLKICVFGVLFLSDIILRSSYLFVCIEFFSIAVSFHWFSFSYMWFMCANNLDEGKKIQKKLNVDSLFEGTRSINVQLLWTNAIHLIGRAFSSVYRPARQCACCWIRCYIHVWFCKFIPQSIKCLSVLSLNPFAMDESKVLTMLWKCAVCSIEWARNQYTIRSCAIDLTEFVMHCFRYVVSRNRIKMSNNVFAHM